MYVTPEKGADSTGFLPQKAVESTSLRCGLIASFSPWLSKFVEKHAEVVESAGRGSNAPLTNGKRSRGLDSAESPPEGGGEARGSGIRRPEGAERVAVAVVGVFLAIHD